MSNANEQAFPITADEDHVRSYGLTKREYFAAMAMQGMLADHTMTGTPDAVAVASVRFAEALLAELAKS